jgi:hypothetical protein
MAIDFSQIDGVPAKTGKIDFSAIGGIPAVGQDEPTDDTTALGAAGRGAVGMLPLGNQAYSAIAGAAEKEPYTQERAELQKEIQADIANHEPSRLAGQAAGLAAPAVLTGGASAPASLGEAVGQGAAVGAGFGAGNAIDTLASGGSGAKAAGDVALGAGLGAAGGAIGEKLAGAAESAVPGIENYAQNKAAASVGMGSEELGNIKTPEQVAAFGKMLIDKKIVRPGANLQDMFNTAEQQLEGAGTTIGAIGDKATELGLTTDTKPLLDTLGKKYQAATDLNNPDEMRNALFYKRGMADIIAMANRNGGERVAPDILTDQPNSFITFDQLAQLKKSYGPSAFINGTVKNPAAADVYGQLGNGQTSIISKAINNPDLPAQLKDAMANYSQLHPVVEGLRELLGRERAGNLPAKGFGMIGKMVSQLPGQSNPLINLLTSAMLLVAGHPMGALGAATATLQNPRAMSSIAQGAANAIPGLAEKLPMAGAQAAGSASPAPTTLNVNHPALAPWKPTFDKNAATAKDAGDVQKSQAVTDFILSQRDPTYAKARQKAADEPVENNAPANLRMAEGGMVPDEGGKIDEPIPAMGSTLQGLTDQLKNPTHEKQPVPMEDLPANTSQGFHQPFNPDFSDKLKDFLRGQKGDKNGGS